MALRGTLTHWKTRLLAQKLGVQPWAAMGLLEALWHTTAELAPSGNIGRLPNNAIAMEMFYEGDADVLIEALLHSGHLDHHDTHRLTIHDWSQHSDYNTRRKVLRRNELMADGNAPRLNMTRHESIPVPEPVPVPEPEPVPEPVKEQKPSRGKREVEFILPEWIEEEDWGHFEEHRKRIGKPMTNHARNLAVKELDALRNKGHTPRAMIDQAILKGWQTFYEPSSYGKVQSPPQPKFTDPKRAYDE